jgi:drug/metabolite transporter (DMT)-like permease
MNDKPNEPAVRGALGVAAASCLWGTWSLFFRPAEAAGPVSAPLEAFVVFATILVVVAPIAIRDRPRLRRSKRMWALMALAGVFDAMNALLFFWAMQKTTLAIAVLTHYVAPVLVAASAPFVLSERSTRRTWAALAVAFAGLVILLEPWRARDATLLGAAFGAGSAVFFAMSLLTAKRLGRDFAPTEILAWHMPSALVLLALFLPESPFAAPPSSLVWLVIAGLGPGVAAGVLFIRGLAHLEASRAAILMLLEPVVAVAVGIVVWHEVPRLWGMLGGAMVLTGAYAVTRRPVRR